MKIEEYQAIIDASTPGKWQWRGTLFPTELTNGFHTILDAEECMPLGSDRKYIATFDPILCGKLVALWKWSQRAEGMLGRVELHFDYKCGKDPGLNADIAILLRDYQGISEDLESTE